MTDVSRLPGPMIDAWEWQYEAACRDLDTELFFHPEGERGSTRRRRAANAKAICATCPVIEQCRSYALAAQEPYGIWGGMTEEERREEIRSWARSPRLLTRIHCSVRHRHRVAAPFYCPPKRPSSPGARMTDNDNKASQNKAEDAPTNLYKTLFFVTAPITAILAGACVWMGVQLSSTSPAGQATPAATPTAAAQMPQNTETAAPSQTNASNLEIMKSFVRHQADDPQAKGDINAPVTMVLFSDFACPYCTKYAQEIDPALADLVADGTLRVEWYDLAQITETSPLAAQAGIAAGEQGKFWEFHDVVYAAADPTGHPQYSEQALVDFAAQAGVPDLDKFRATMLADHTVSKVKAAKEQAHQAGISGTPTMFINKAFVSGYRDASYIRNTILEQAAQSAS